MSNMQTVDIIEFTRESNIDLVTAFSYAYTYADQSTKAPEVGAYNTGATPEQQEQQKKDTELYMARAMNVLDTAAHPTMLFPSKDDFQRKWLQYGKQRWQLMFSQGIYVGTPKDMVPHGQ